MRDCARLLLLCAPFALTTSCLRLEALQAIGPVVKLTAPVSSVDATAGDQVSVSAQALDVNGVGVNGAWVTFAQGDLSRLSWADAPTAADAVTEETASADVAAVSGDGVATARANLPIDAPAGDVTVFAVLKGPADNSATLTAQIVVHVKAAADAGPADAAPTDSTDDGNAAAGMGGTGS